jgi:hypothetical protein
MVNKILCNRLSADLICNNFFKIRFGAINMDYNELSYLETLGSLPVFYPVVRYFHGATQTAKDYEELGRLDVVAFIDFVKFMREKYRPRADQAKIGKLAKHDEL